MTKRLKVYFGFIERRNYFFILIKIPLTYYAYTSISVYFNFYFGFLLISFVENHSQLIISVSGIQGLMHFSLNCIHDFDLWMIENER